MLRTVLSSVGLIGLALSVIGTLRIIRAGAETIFDKDIGAFITKETDKKLLKNGLWLLAVGFILQLIEKGILFIIN